ncbi:MAG: hypothetical protein NTY98_00895 [Verrucomicrobia bacterium]|nr:hypothetical protein [Verrucomicrobiota bacterium]
MAALKSLGEALVLARHRVFEYQHHRAESRTADILEMMNWQLRLSDAVIFVVSRSSYEAPGWTVPELFLAHALGKQVLCVALGKGRDFTPDKFGDVVSDRRYRALLPAGGVFPGVDALLLGLEELQQRLGLEDSSPFDAFELLELLWAWSEGGRSLLKEGPPASIEGFLQHYWDAWKIGFRPARLFLKTLPPPPVAPERDWVVNCVSHWLDDRHVVVRWQQSKSQFNGGVTGSVADAAAGSVLTLLDVRTGRHTMAAVPNVQIYTAGTTRGGAGLVTVTAWAQTGAEYVRLERFGISDADVTSGLAGSSHAFVYALPDSVCCSGGIASASGVIDDCWFAGSTLLRIVWEEQRLEQISPQPQDWARFSHFGWREATVQSELGAVSASLPAKPCMVKFPSCEDQWTLLPPDWQYLCGDQAETSGLLVAYKNGVLAFGDVACCPLFGTDLPAIETLPDPGQDLPHMVVAPQFLQTLQINRATLGEEAVPLDMVSRMEAEDALLIEWFGVAPPSQQNAGKPFRTVLASACSCLYRFHVDRRAMLALKQAILADPVPSAVVES